jgi:hypothetical protein
VLSGIGDIALDDDGKPSLHIHVVLRDFAVGLVFDVEPATVAFEKAPSAVSDASLTPSRTANPVIAENASSRGFKISTKVRSPAFFCDEFRLHRLLRGIAVRTPTTGGGSAGEPMESKPLHHRQSVSRKRLLHVRCAIAT